MLLNCDLGESYGNWRMGLDAEVMPYIDQANVACGYHAGDPVTMRSTLQLAAEHGVAVGAHPAYPDLAGFGRRSMALSDQEIIAMLHYQVGALEGIAGSLGLSLVHVKPHGALYHDMMLNAQVRAAILEALASYHRPLVLLMQATSASDNHAAEAKAAGVDVQFEAFADRRYSDDGRLLSRDQAGAVLGSEELIKQAKQLIAGGTVTTAGGNALPLHADTLCVHGDNPEGVRTIAKLHDLLRNG